MLLPRQGYVTWYMCAQRMQVRAAAPRQGREVAQHHSMCLSQGSSAWLFSYLLWGWRHHKRASGPKFVPAEFGVSAHTLRAASVLSTQQS